MQEISEKIRLAGSSHFHSTRKTFLVLAFMILSVLAGSFAMPCAYGQAQSPKDSSSNSFEMRDMFNDWLTVMKDAIKDEYYDAKYHGIDLNARFDAARAKINESDYDWQMFRVLAQIMMDFDDAHTSLILPRRKEHFDYGFDMQMIGSDCLVTRVTKGSDADKVGLEVGDKIVKVGDISPDRDNLWKVLYVLYSLAPTDTLELAVKKENSPEKALKVNALITTDKQYAKEQEKRKDKEESDLVKCTELNKEIIACKLYTFRAQKSDIDKMMKLVAGYSKLILDLRGNSGGLAEMDEYLTGYFFGHNVKMVDILKRKKTEERFAKSKGKNVFSGDLVVLVDSNSASASEIFARVVQLEKRGKVVGDVTSGFVMLSVQIALLRVKQRFGYTSKAFPLFMNLSVGDVVMSDGARLEKKGVIPDIGIIPTGSALKNGLDPVMVVAANIFGLNFLRRMRGKCTLLSKNQMMYISKPAISGSGSQRFYRGRN